MGSNQSVNQSVEAMGCCKQKPDQDDSARANNVISPHPRDISLLGKIKESGSPPTLVTRAHIQYGGQHSSTSFSPLLSGSSPCEVLCGNILLKHEKPTKRRCVAVCYECEHHAHMPT
jgi:hypothetical protein